MKPWITILVAGLCAAIVISTSIQRFRAERGLMRALWKAITRK